VVCIIVLPKASYGQSSNDTINVNGTNYVIFHTIDGGKILDISMDTQSKTMKISIQSTSNGNITIDLPRILIDAKENGSDTHYVVLANNHGVGFKELVTADYRELTIPFLSGTNTIEIKGTQVVPEFGSLVSLILIASIVITMTISQSNKPGRKSN
jgi:predicted secreted protein with PEFG-CTERM motif